MACEWMKVSGEAVVFNDLVRNVSGRLAPLDHSVSPGLSDRSGDRLGAVAAIRRALSVARA
jgi:hypothetical protein